MGMYGSSSTTTYMPPQQLSLGETLKSAMQAQGNPELNRMLFEAESNEEYGRPAYARLEQRVINTALYGQKHTVDENGNIQRLVKSSIPEDAYYTPQSREEILDFIEDKVYADFEAKGKPSDHPWQTIGTLESILDRRYGDPEDDNWYSAHIKTMEDAGIEIPTIGEAFDKDYNKLDRELEYETEYVGIEKAGQAHYEGGGLVETMAGSQEHTFRDADGNEVTRKIGFDENGQPMGLSGVARDLEQVDKAQRFASEINFMKEYGDDFTEAFRSQGDIQGALNEVERLTNASAIPDKGIDSRGTIMTDITDRINQNASRIASPYGQPAMSRDPLQPSASEQFKEDFNTLTDKGGKRIRTNFEREDTGDTGTELTQEQSTALVSEKFGGIDPLEIKNNNDFKISNDELIAFFRGLPDWQQEAYTRGQGFVRDDMRQILRNRLDDAEKANPNFLSDLRRARETEAIDQTQVQPKTDSAVLGEQPQTATAQSQTSQPQTTQPQTTQPQMSSGGKLTDERGVDRVYAGRGADDITYNPVTDKVSEDPEFSEITGGDADYTIGEDSIRDVSADQNVRDIGVSGDIREVGERQVGDLGGLRSGLVQEATSDLALGGDLSARDRRFAQQDARIAMQARGRLRDTASILAELENNENLRRARKNERRAFASDIAGREGAFATTDAQLGLQADSLNQSRDQALVGYNLQADQSNQGADLQQRGQDIDIGRANQQGDIYQVGVESNIAMSDADRALRAQTGQAGVDQAQFNARQAGEMFNVTNATRQGELGLQAQQANQSKEMQLGAREFGASSANQAGQLQLTGMDQQAQMFQSGQDFTRDQMLLSSAGADLGRQIQVDQYNTQMEMSGLQQDRNMAMQRVGIETGTASDPLMAVTGRPSGAGSINAGALYAGGQQTSQVPELFNPMVGAQFYADQNSNLNDYNIAYGNQQAEISAGRSNMVGNILQGALSMIPGADIFKSITKR